MGAKVILVLVGIGLIMGLALISSELVNPLSGLSRYERARVETQRKAQQYDIDMKGYEAAASSHRQQAHAMELQGLAEENRHREEMNALRKQMLEDQYNHQQQLQEKELQRIQAIADFEKVVLEIAGIVLPWAVGLAVIFLSVGLSFRIASTPVATPGISRVLIGTLSVALALAGSGTVVLLLNYFAA